MGLFFFAKGVRSAQAHVPALPPFLIVFPNNPPSLSHLLCSVYTCSLSSAQVLLGPPMAYAPQALGLLSDGGRHALRI